MILVLMSGNNHAVDYIILLQRITLEDRTKRNRYALFSRIKFSSNEEKETERERERGETSESNLSTRINSRHEILSRKINNNRT